MSDLPMFSSSDSCENIWKKLIVSVQYGQVKIYSRIAKAFIINPYYGLLVRPVANAMKVLQASIYESVNTGLF